jgi:hypothetical protein
MKANLSFEFDAAGPMCGWGFHALKALQLAIPKMSSNKGALQNGSVLNGVGVRPRPNGSDPAFTCKLQRPSVHMIEISDIESAAYGARF